MPHIILYNPPSSASRKSVLPMSLLAIGQILEGEFDYSIVDGNLVRDTVGALEREIRTTKADILAVTVMPGPQLFDAVPTCMEIKRCLPDVTIVWGGYFPTQHFDVCLKAEYVDYVVRGHGEFSFRALVRALRAGDRAPHVPGLAYRDGFHQSQQNQGELGQTTRLFDSSTTGFRQAQPAQESRLALAQPTITDLGTAPIPHPRDLPDLFPYHKVDVPRYLRKTFMGNRTLPHHSSYGCPFFCNFCAVVNMVNGGWKAQTAEQVANVAQHLVKTYGVDAIEFDDNNFFTAEARVAEFCERIIGMGMKIGWWGEARIDTMMKYSDRTWALMRDAGLRMVFLGAESGSDETLARMNKGGTASAEKTMEIAGKMQRYGIVPEMSFVLGNPPDPETDARATMDFIRKVKRVNPATEIIMYMYTPVPLAGELYDQAKAEGFAFPETLEEWIGPAWQEFSQRRSTHVPWLQDPIQRRIRNFQWVLNAYYPTMTDVTMSRFKRAALRAISAWRYHLGVYALPYELKAAHRVLAYQRPETSGF